MTDGTIAFQLATLLSGSDMTQRAGVVGGVWCPPGINAEAVALQLGATDTAQGWKFRDGSVLPRPKITRL